MGMNCKHTEGRCHHVIPSNSLYPSHSGSPFSFSSPLSPEETPFPSKGVTSSLALFINAESLDELRALELLSSVPLLRGLEVCTSISSGLSISPSWFPYRIRLCIDVVFRMQGPVPGKECPFKQHTIKPNDEIYYRKEDVQNMAFITEGRTTVISWCPR